ncbi:scavenger receptor cysteine-rich type 1 protein M130-like [Heterodontus francisci]|uniref:scavenger receptor cysteine-rich type 1 protein M130-like n=1 Tax=Heterodontus francisci TaxID=7792 RepID=UPI00355C9614
MVAVPLAAKVTRSRIASLNLSACQPLFPASRYAITNKLFDLAFDHIKAIGDDSKCLTKITDKDHVQVRLSDGGSPCTGRVEICYNGIWGSVCDDSWDQADADVVCKQLGCGKALDLALPASCERGSGPVWLDELKCFEHKQLRLVNGKHRCEGRVEVFYNGTWGTVCSDTLDRPDAEVICEQLQCGPLSYIDYYTLSFGEGSAPIWLDGMECISHDSFLWQCQTEPWGKHNCEHREDAGVICSDSGHWLRLFEGNTNCSGRVEILCNNSWGTVCDDSWDLSDANVVCRQLGCGHALLAPGGATFSQGDGVIWLDEVKCTGSESSLADCRFDVPPIAFPSTSAAFYGLSGDLVRNTLQSFLLIFSIQGAPE